MSQGGGGVGVRDRVRRLGGGRVKVRGTSSSVLPLYPVCPPSLAAEVHAEVRAPT